MDDVVKDGCSQYFGGSSNNDDDDEVQFQTNVFSIHVTREIHRIWENQTGSFYEFSRSINFSCNL